MALKDPHFTLVPKTQIYSTVYLLIFCREKGAKTDNYYDSQAIQSQFIFSELWTVWGKGTLEGDYANSTQKNIDRPAGLTPEASFCEVTVLTTAQNHNICILIPAIMPLSLPCFLSVCTSNCQIKEKQKTNKRCKQKKRSIISLLIVTFCIK